MSSTTAEATTAPPAATATASPALTQPTKHADPPAKPRTAGPNAGTTTRLSARSSSATNRSSTLATANGTRWITRRTARADVGHSSCIPLSSARPALASELRCLGREASFDGLPSGWGARSVAPSLVGAAVLGTALTYHSGRYSRPPPLSRTTTNGRTFGAQFARILMWPPSVFACGRPKLARGPSRPATFTGVGFPGGRARGGWLGRPRGERSPIGRGGRAFG